MRDIQDLHTVVGKLGIEASKSQYSSRLLAPQLMALISREARDTYLQNRLPVVDGSLSRHCLQHFGDILDVRKSVSELVDGRLILGLNKALHSLVALVDRGQV